MIKKIVLLAGIFTLCLADNDDKKWVWNENSRNSNARSGLSLQNPKTRYNVFEETDEYRPVGGNQYFPGSQPGPVNQRPPPIYENRPPIYPNRPPIPGGGFVPEERPGGIYGNVPRPTYGGQPENPGILTGPVPSWVKDGPIKNFDKCKCTAKFNCNSPGISYGHCDVGKQYCCYSTTKQLGGPIPSRPVHSIENGILVGPGGPVDPTPGITNYPRPPKQLGGGYFRPGGFLGSQGFGPNEYSPENGVLVGPGGPYDNYNADYGLGRSAKITAQADKKSNK